MFITKKVLLICINQKSINAVRVGECGRVKRSLLANVNFNRLIFFLRVNFIVLPYRGCREQETRDVLNLLFDMIAYLSTNDSVKLFT